jgi:hypothetical protein
MSKMVVSAIQQSRPGRAVSRSTSRGRSSRYNGKVSRSSSGSRSASRPRYSSNNRSRSSSRSRNTHVNFARKHSKNDY